MDGRMIFFYYMNTNNIYNFIVHTIYNEPCLGAYLIPRGNSVGIKGFQKRTPICALKVR